MLRGGISIPRIEFAKISRCGGDVYRANDMQASVAAYSAVAGRAKRYMATGENREFSRSEKNAAGDEFDPSA